MLSSSLIHDSTTVVGAVARLIAMQCFKTYTITHGGNCTFSFHCIYHQNNGNLCREFWYKNGTAFNTAKQRMMMVY